MKMEEKQLIIVTGMSGAGKSTALNILEDLDFYTIDNLPIGLEKYLPEINVNKLAVGVDIRTLKKTEDFFEWISKVENEKLKYQIIYLDADISVILGRYNLTRRKHPIKSDSLLESVKKEKEIMEGIKEKSHFVIDTSFLRTNELANKIKEIIAEEFKINSMKIHLQSFGFKYGVPIDADLMFDLRFIPNPYYIDDLKNKTGFDKEVKNYVMKNEISQKFLDKLKDFIDFLLEEYITEGKKHLTIAIGCSGGQHRSVVFVELLKEYLSKNEKIEVYSYHRENVRGYW